MTARRIAVLAALVTMGGSGWYVFLYLTRWEWNRATVAGMIFLAAEVALVGLLMIDRIARGQPAPTAPAPPVTAPPASAAPVTPPRAGSEPDPRVLSRLQTAAPNRHEPFAWLRRPPEGLSVFVPVLLGAGVVLSGAAWVVERLAHYTAEASLDRRIARKLEPLAPPRGGLLDDDPDRSPDNPFFPQG